MLTDAIITLALLPAYLVARSPYVRLPLHIDTGFYVSNATVATGTFSFAGGWNAHFAGCSKALPEWLYSRVFLRHCRRTSDLVSGKSRPYQHYSRFYASLYNYATAIAVGFLACRLAGGDIRYYYAGLLAYALVSSEPQYGVYYECGELFEVLWQVLSLTFLVIGMEQGNAWWIAIAAFTWSIETFFIKLSSGVAFVILFGAATIISPPAWLPIVAGGAIGTTLYAVWMRLNGQRTLALLRGLVGHETSFGQRAEWARVVHRLREKTACLIQTVRRQPLLPLLAALGMIWAPPDKPAVWIFLIALLVTYAAQAADCWYYQITLLAPLSLFAAGFIVLIDSWGSLGAAFLVCAAAAWLLHNPIRAARLDTDALTRWCWNGQSSPRVLSQDLLLEDMADRLAPVVHGKELLVYGPLSQAYVLLNAAYATPIVVPEFYLDDMSEGWQPRLHEQMVESPPAFILDSANCFDAQAARAGLGLDYRLTHACHDSFRLFALVERSAPDSDVARVCTFRVQSAKQLAAERDCAGIALTVLEPSRPIPKTVPGLEPSETKLARTLQTLSASGVSRIAIYGAGRFTKRNIETYRNAPLCVAVVADDDPRLHGDRFLDWPLRSLEAAREFEIEAVVVSTDRYIAPMLARARQMWDGKIPVLAADSPIDSECTQTPPQRQTETATTVPVPAARQSISSIS